ncbi:hypothetical protein BvL003_14670 [Bacillus velezensis]|uniref:hypothetical protein n=1 Tax=Bacillus TaxID=1386 RepID=UPI0012AA0694|nr:MULTISPECIES: hypothetical protein [Bacillus amyloliquefaciens group]QGJ65963.1 hypothetical protein BvL003_14670 [Bacillus velezensis]
MTETNASIHVLADETLGGIKREYVEVDRKAEVGEKIVIVNADVQCEEPYHNGYRFEVESLLGCSRGIQTACHRDIFDFEYHVLEPTDIVHIDGERYELTDRKAEVGEKIIHLYEGESSGIAREVRKTDDEGVEVDPYKDEEGVWIGLDHGYYRVLVPVETAEDEPKPADPIDVIASLAKEVAALKRTVNRHRDEIDTLYKDKRTLGEELARLKEPTKTAECAPIDAPLVFIQRKIGDAFDVYQDGKKLRGVRHIRIDAADGEFTTHDIEFVSGATEEERP